MDCHTAQAQLDLTRNGSDAVGGPDTQTARRHVAECPSCQMSLQSSQNFDRQVSQAMSDVPLPQGLNGRLLAAVGQSAVSPLPTAAAPGSRRSTLRWLGIGALALLVPLAAISLAPRTSSLGPASIKELAEHLDELSVDAPKDAFSAPNGWTSLRSLQFQGTRLATVSGTKVPVQSFLMRIGRTSTASGFLVRMSSKQWRGNSDALSFPKAQIEYATFGTWAAWREGDSVYICVLSDNAQAMQRLQDLIDGARGLS